MIEDFYDLYDIVALWIGRFFLATIIVGLVGVMMITLTGGWFDE